MSTIYLLNKPYGTLCQFKAIDDRPTLASLIRTPDIYPAGRLDHDSEGLLLLTDDGQLQAQISHPRYKLPKTYRVQVEGEVNQHALDQLRKGVSLNDGITKPAKAKAIIEPDLWLRDPPVRFRKNIPTSWLELTITEGRNRQVRRMTAAVGFPTLRLVRVRIGNWSLERLLPGESRTEQVHIAAPTERTKSHRNERKENHAKSPSRKGNSSHRRGGR